MRALLPLQAFLAKHCRAEEFGVENDMQRTLVGKPMQWMYAKLGPAIPHASFSFKNRYLCVKSPRFFPSSCENSFATVSFWSLKQMLLIKAGNCV